MYFAYLWSFVGSPLPLVGSGNPFQNMDRAAEIKWLHLRHSFQISLDKAEAFSWIGHILPSGWAGNMSLLTNVYQELRSWKLPVSTIEMLRTKTNWGSFRASGQLWDTQAKRTEWICTQSGCEFAYLYLRRTTARPVVGLIFAVWSEKKDSKQGSKHTQILPNRYLLENHNNSYLKLHSMSFLLRFVESLWIFHI